ncbi:MAG: PleD family two-component system response regulator [Myxococcota bacterium]
MTGRVLVVDDVRASLAMLESQLLSEYLEVATASSGSEALQILPRFRPDVVLLDVVMPGMDGFEVCRRIKSTPETSHVPVVMVTGRDTPELRVRALEVGAEDFLSKPVDPEAMVAQVRSLVRYKVAMDELIAREQAGRDYGLADADRKTVLGVDVRDGQVLLVDDRDEVIDEVRKALAPAHRVHVEKDAKNAMLLVHRADLDLVLVGLEMHGTDGLRVCSQVRSGESSRHTPMLAVAGHQDHERLVRALEIGANGFVRTESDPKEILARVESQIRSKRYRDLLGQNMRRSLEKAVRDPLTGMYNRRYLDTHLDPVVAVCVESEKPVALLMMDIDNFKEINDRWGHDVGDKVLCEVSHRLHQNLRSLDLFCRYGGEEFVAVFPGAPLRRAQKIAERLRGSVADEPFPVSLGEEQLSVSVSIGLAMTQGVEDTSDLLLKRADQALYRAKKEGRNRVVDEI